MVTKIAAVVFAVAVAALGSYVYINSSCDHGPCPNAVQAERPADSQSDCSLTQLPSCCQQPGRASLIEAPCCAGDHESPSTVEVLTIQPREVK